MGVDCSSLLLHLMGLQQGNGSIVDSFTLTKLRAPDSTKVPREERLGEPIRALAIRDAAFHTCRIRSV